MDDGAVLSQTLAIAEFLDELHPEPRFLPTDPVARAHVRSMALSIACDIHPLNNLRVLNYLRNELAQSEDAVMAWYGHWIQQGFSALEILAREHSRAQRYMFADSVSLADICLVPQMFNARRFHVDVSSFPTLVAISTHLEALPAFAAARPDAQPDAA
jgi:maleylacetoacetate isomerase